MREFYELHVGDLRQIVPFDRTIREEWYRKSIKDKNLEQGYIDLFKRIRCDLEGLEELPERFRNKATMEYTKNFSLAEALREGRRLEELEKSIEERRRKLEAEQKEQKGKSQKIDEIGSAHESRETTKEVSGNSTAQEVYSGNPVICLDFRVWGTRYQLMELRQYMIDNHLKFGKVE